MYQKPLETDRQDVLCHDPRQGNLSSQSHCSLMWLFSRFVALSAAALTGQTIYSRGWSFMMFIFLTELYHVKFILCLCTWNHTGTSDLERTYRSNQGSLKCRYLLVLTNNLTFLMFVYVFTLYIVARGSLLCSPSLEYV